MIKINWNSLTNQEKLFLNDYIRASVLNIAKVHEMQRLIDEGLLNDVCEVSKIINLPKKILSHKCTGRRSPAIILQLIRINISPENLKEKIP